MILRLVEGFVVLLVGVSLMPTIYDQVNTALNASSSSSMTSTMAAFVPGLFALAVLGIGVLITYSSLRSMGTSEEIDDGPEEVEVKENPKESKPHEQTYLEYVRERLSVERLLRRFG